MDDDAFWDDDIDDAMLLQASQMAEKKKSQEAMDPHELAEMAQLLQDDDDDDADNWDSGAATSGADNSFAAGKTGTGGRAQDGGAARRFRFNQTQTVFKEQTSHKAGRSNHDPGFSGGHNGSADPFVKPPAPKPVANTPANRLPATSASSATELKRMEEELKRLATENKRLNEEKYQTTGEVSFLRSELTKSKDSYERLSRDKNHQLDLRAEQLRQLERQKKQLLDDSQTEKAFLEQDLRQLQEQLRRRPAAAAASQLADKEGEEEEERAGRKDRKKKKNKQPLAVPAGIDASLLEDETSSSPKRAKVSSFTSLSASASASPKKVETKETKETAAQTPVRRVRTRTLKLRNTYPADSDDQLLSLLSDSVGPDVLSLLTRTRVGGGGDPYSTGRDDDEDVLGLLLQTTSLDGHCSKRRRAATSLVSAARQKALRAAESEPWRNRRNRWNRRTQDNAEDEEKEEEEEKLEIGRLLQTATIVLEYCRSRDGDREREESRTTVGTAMEVGGCLLKRDFSASLRSDYIGLLSILLRQNLLTMTDYDAVLSGLRDFLKQKKAQQQQLQESSVGFEEVPAVSCQLLCDVLQMLTDGSACSSDGSFVGKECRNSRDLCFIYHLCNALSPHFSNNADAADADQENDEKSPKWLLVRAFLAWTRTGLSSWFVTSGSGSDQLVTSGSLCRWCRTDVVKTTAQALVTLVTECTEQAVKADLPQSHAPSSSSSSTSTSSVSASSSLLHLLLRDCLLLLHRLWSFGPQPESFGRHLSHHPHLRRRYVWCTRQLAGRLRPALNLHPSQASILDDISVEGEEDPNVTKK